MQGGIYPRPAGPTRHAGRFRPRSGDFTGALGTLFPHRASQVMTDPDIPHPSRP